MRFERFMSLILMGSVGLAVSTQDISGTVWRERESRPVANVHLRLRNVDTGVTVSETVSDANGAFTFVAPARGLYVIEAVDTHGVRANTQPIAFTDSPLTADVILPASRTKDALRAGALLSVVAAGAVGGIAALSGGQRVESPER